MGGWDLLREDEELSCFSFLTDCCFSSRVFIKPVPRLSEAEERCELCSFPFRVQVCRGEVLRIPAGEVMTLHQGQPAGLNQGLQAAAILLV